MTHDINKTGGFAVVVDILVVVPLYWLSADVFWFKICKSIMFNWGGNYYFKFYVMCKMDNYVSLKCVLTKRIYSWTVPIIWSL